MESCTSLVERAAIYAKSDAPNHQLRADIQFSRNPANSRTVPAFPDTSYYAVSFRKSQLFWQFLLDRANGLNPRLVATVEKVVRLRDFRIPLSKSTVRLIG